MKMVEGLFVWVMMYVSMIISKGGFCCLEEERIALIQIKESMNGPEGSALSSWYGDEDCCLWEAVECNPSTNTIIKLFINDRRDKGLAENWYPNASLFAQLKDLQELQLQGNKIAGFTSPNALQELKHLQKLNLRRNSIQEGSQLCWGEMKSLQNLDLSSNNLQGRIPVGCLCEMHSITKLRLSDNLLHGDLGFCFSNMSFLQHLDISGNPFNGSFPSLVFSNLTNIETLKASHNLFSGKISLSVFSNLSRLSYLDISYNEHLDVDTESLTWLPCFELRELYLGGCNLNNHIGNKIPGFLSTQYHLLSLDLSSNSLVGSIPSWLLYNGTSALLLRDNRLSGSFPKQMKINTSSNLEVLDISENFFHGPLPSNFDTLFPKLYSFNASWNKFGGGIPPLTEMRLLQSLDLSSNRLVGEFPICTEGNMTTSSLEYLVLSKNNLQGKMLPRNFSFAKLKELQLSGNNFTKLDSHSLSTCTALQVLDLSENNLSGELSTQLPSLTALKIILLRQNHFEGRIPKQLCQMNHLHILDMSTNNFSHTIPLCFNNVTYWTGEYEDIEYFPSYYVVMIFRNQDLVFHGRVLNSFTAIDLSTNQLTGLIPIQVGDLKNIRSLNISNNHLTSTIPTSLGNLSNVESLGFSRNKLFGQIPRELTDLEFLVVFDASFNNLSGPVPRGLQFDTFTNDSYEGNPHLCGFPVAKPCSSNVSTPPPTADSTCTDHQRRVLVRLVVLMICISLLVFPTM